MTWSLAIALVLLVSCELTPADDGLRPIASTSIASTGPIARHYLATPGFAWHSYQSRHIRLHLAAGMATSRARELADSAESARNAALALTGDFYSLPELPAYFTAASLVEFLQRRRGVATLRALWRGEQAGVDRLHPLGGETQELEQEWKREMANTRPAVLDTARLRRDGC